jgi:hypothetical protein
LIGILLIWSKEWMCLPAYPAGQLSKQVD